MKRLIIATVALLIVAGVTYWTLSQKPEVSPEVMQKIKLVSRFKDTLPVAEGGNADAQYAIAEMYETGDGTKKDNRKAVEWLLKAADQGHADARFKLGWMHANGGLVRQDYFLAAKYYRLAATFNNHPEAQFRLGELHFNGRGSNTITAKPFRITARLPSKVMGRRSLFSAPCMKRDGGQTRSDHGLYLDETGFQ